MIELAEAVLKRIDHHLMLARPVRLLASKQPVLSSGIPVVGILLVRSYRTDHRTQQI